MENLTSTPLSMRDSGSAFMSQYCRPVFEDPSTLFSALGPDLAFAATGDEDFFAFAPPVDFELG